MKQYIINDAMFCQTTEISLLINNVVLIYCRADVHQYCRTDLLLCCRIEVQVYFSNEIQNQVGKSLVKY